MEGVEVCSLFDATANVNPFALASFSREKWEYMALFDTERWYDELPQWTFPTWFLALSVDEGRALVAYFQRNVLGRRGGEVFTEKHRRDLAGLKERLDSVMQQQQEEENDGGECGGDGCYFVRLSSRSPKDVGLNGDHPQILTSLRQELDRLNATSVNDKLRALQTAVGRVLKVSTAEAALSLIGTSERTYTDLLHYLEDESSWKMKVVIRRWVDGIDVGNEYRGFVCCDQLTALCQYNDLCFYPALVGNEEKVVEGIVDVWLKARERLNLLYQAYIIDFVIVGTSVYIIEINPFGPMTGASLFDWKLDRKLLQGGANLWFEEESPKEEEEPEEVELNPNVLQMTFNVAEQKKPLYFRRLKNDLPLDASYLEAYPLFRMLSSNKGNEEAVKEAEGEKEDRSKSKCITC
ncbi:ATP-grasp domain-containing protein [Balamuthia mandrillaris]